MLKNYLITAWRNLARNKSLAFINIVGLSLGMAFTILIGMWIHYQYSYDNFNVNKDRIALVGKHMMVNNQKETSVSVMLPLYDELKAKYPGIERASRLSWNDTYILNAGNNKINKAGYCVDPDFLRIFSFPSLKGDVNTALSDPNSIVLTAPLAKALFGNEDPIGKVVKVDNQYPLHVTAVLQEIPSNSSIRFDLLLPFQFRLQNDEGARSSMTRWNNSFLRIVVETKAGADMNVLSAQIADVAKGKDVGLKVLHFFLYPLSRWNLYGDWKDWVETGTQIEYIRLFGIIGLFILIIACINFMNLSTARSERRAREVGIRKTIGSGRGQLIVQFLTESLLTSSLAFMLSLVLIQILLPFLKDLGFEYIRFNWTNLPLMGSVLAVCLVTGLIAGSYPAFYLSAFRPVKVLKGVVRQGGNAISFRKALVVIQFVVSIALITSTVIIVRQIEYARSRPIGYDPNNLISFDASQDITKNFAAMKRDLLNTGRVAAVTRSSSAMTWISNDFGHFSWEGKDPHADIFIKTVMADYDYEKTAGLQLVAGRAFSKDLATDSSAIILNEAMVNLIGYKDPVGKTMKLGNEVLTIIGITKNMVMEDPFKAVPPETILLKPSDGHVVLLRLKDGADLKATLSMLGPIVERYNPASPWDYHFAQEEFEKKFSTENQVAKLAAIFAALAILISCLGLFGLAMFMAERRSKEISIRKVLGATVSGLWMLMSREFFWLVLIASLIASPIAVWLMSGWLRNYQYRIQIPWWIPALVSLLAIVVAIVTVSAQAIRAATASPVKNLKQE